MKRKTNNELFISNGKKKNFFLANHFIDAANYALTIYGRIFSELIFFEKKS